MALFAWPDGDRLRDRIFPFGSAVVSLSALISAWLHGVHMRYRTAVLVLHAWFFRHVAA